MIARKSPLRRSRVKAKPTKRSTEKNRADKLWSLLVRLPWMNAEACELARWHEAKFPCSGPLQACHGFSRRYLGTRYVPLNGFAGCAAAHRWYTTHPIEWDLLLRDAWGETVYEELRQRALTFKGPLDYRLIADALR